ncbi:DUF5011 domain-containing protein [Patescibacteria group bacterium]|nr:DUF5011 domain-containing protein [Patescibacteria group bacterium]
MGNSSGGYALTATSSLGLASLSSFSASAPLSYNSGTGAFSISQSNGSTNGYLSSGDWTTFNNKISSTSLSGGTGISYNSGTGVIANTGVLSLAQTYGSTQTGALTFGTSSDANLLLNVTNSGNAFTFTPVWQGTLADARIASAANWNTAYANRITSAVYPLQISANTISTAFSTTTANSFNQPQTFTNGATANSLTLGSLNGPLQANNGLVSATTSMGVLYGGTGLTSAPSYGNILVGNSSGGYALTATSSLGLASLSSFSASAPLSYNSGTGAFSISQSNGSTNGYLSSGDWTTFNNKISSTSLSASYPLAYNSGTGAFTYNGLATTSAWTQGQLAYVAGNNAITGVATTSPALGSEFAYSGTLGALVGGSSGTLTLATNGTALTKLSQIAANTLLANPTGAPGNVQAVATSSLGLTVSSFASPNISQWTNNSGYLTTVNNGNWSGTQLSVANGGTGSTTLTGILKGAGTSQIGTAVNGTDYTLITANTCGAGNHVSAITAAGVITCSADTGGTGAPFAWTPTSWGVSTSTTLGFLNGFISTASSTFTASPIISSLATPAGTFLAADPTGKIIATTTPSGGASAVGGTGAVQFANGTAFNGDSSNFFWDNTNKRLGLGTTSPWATLSIAPATRATPFAVASSSGSTLFAINPAGQAVFGTTTSANIFLNGGGDVTSPSSVGNNVAIGNKAFSYYDPTQATNNIAMGYQALYGKSGTPMTGTDNFAAGYQAGNYNTSGSNNFFIGNLAGYKNTSGYNNFFVGNSAGYSNDGGAINTFIGPNAGKNNYIGSNNFFVGNSAGFSNFSGGSNVFLGTSAGYTNYTGSNNLFFGTQAGSSNYTGNYNTFIGYQTGTYNSSGGNNVGVGYNTLFNVTTGSDNYMLGDTQNSGGNNITTGGNNILLGYNAGIGTTTSTSNFLNLGNSFFGTLIAKSALTSLPTSFSGASFAIATSGTLYNSTLSVQNNASASSVLSLYSNAGVKVFGVSDGGIASTTGLIVSNAGGIAGCATFAADGTISNTHGACGGSGTYPFTPATNFNASASATTTALWAQAGLFASSTSAYPTLAVSQLGAGAAATFMGGNVGIGTTSPWAQLSVNPDGITGPAFAIGSSSMTYAMVDNAGRFYIGTTTDSVNAANTAGLTVNMGNTNASENAINAYGNVNDFLQIQTQNFSKGSAAQSGFSATADNGTQTTGFMWMGINNSNFWNPQPYNVGGPGDTSLLGLGNDMYIANGSANKNLYFLAGGVSTSTNLAMTITSANMIGIGTTSPWASLSLITNDAADAITAGPAFVVATTSNWTSSGGNGIQAPLIFATATTSGMLDYARVSIGATSTWASAAGLRDQFTVAGRIYQTWAYMSCDIPSSAGANTNALSADTNAACGNFFLDTLTDGAAYTQTGIYPAVMLLSPGIAATFAANEGVSLREWGNTMPATSSPVLEVRGRITNITSTSTMYIIGFSDTPANTTASAGSYPANGVFFEASSTSNTWRATTRVNGVSVGYVDTGVGTTTALSNGVLNRFRIEVTPTTNTFLIDGNVVAVTRPVAAPYKPMAPMVFVVRANGALAAAVNTNGAVASFSVASMRAWDDDPPDSLQVGAPSFTSQAAPPYDPLQGADIAENELVDAPGAYIPGMIVSAASGTSSAMVSRSSGRYDNGILGVVSTSPNSTLGAQSDQSVRVGILGRAPVIVSLENGPIHKGDRITSSSLGGIGMRSGQAGRVVGIALQDFSGGACDSSLAGDVRGTGVAVPETACLGTVLVSLQVGTDIGITTLYQDGSVNSSGVPLDKIALTSDRLTVSGAAFAKSFEVPAGIGTSFTLGSSTVTATLPSSVLTASSTVDLYKLATYNLSGVEALASKISAQDLRIASLETRVAALESGAVAVATSSALSLSTSSLASALSAVGAFIGKGFAQFGTLIADQFVAATNSAGTSSAGTVTILAGNTVAKVNNSYVLPTSKIFVTLTASTTGSWYISDKQPGSFKLVLSEPQTNDISFDYFIVQTEGQVATSTPDSTTVSQSSGPDTTAPVITVLGDNPLHLSIGGTFTEPGVTVLDNVDGTTDPIITFVNGVQQVANASTISTSIATTYIITYSATDKAGNSSSATRSVIVGNPDGTVTITPPATSTPPTTPPAATSTPADTTPPVVTLNGSAAMQISIGNAFIDPGATANDAVDGNLTATIVKTGSVNTNAAGLYTLTYSATDKAGNTGSASRVVTVVAASSTPPVVPVAPPAPTAATLTTSTPAAPTSSTPPATASSSPTTAALTS